MPRHLVVARLFATAARRRCPEPDRALCSLQTAAVQDLRFHCQVRQFSIPVFPVRPATKTYPKPVDRGPRKRLCSVRLIPLSRPIVLSVHRSTPRLRFQAPVAAPPVTDASAREIAVRLPGYPVHQSVALARRSSCRGPVLAPRHLAVDRLFATAASPTPLPPARAWPRSHRA